MRGRRPMRESARCCTCDEVAPARVDEPCRMGYRPVPVGDWRRWSPRIARRGAGRPTMAMITDASPALESEAEGLAFARGGLRIEAEALDRVRGRLGGAVP